MDTKINILKKEFDNFVICGFFDKEIKEGKNIEYIKNEFFKKLNEKVKYARKEKSFVEKTFIRKDFANCDTMRSLSERLQIFITDYDHVTLKERENYHITLKEFLTQEVKKGNSISECIELLERTNMMFKRGFTLKHGSPEQNIADLIDSVCKDPDLGPQFKIELSQQQFLNQFKKISIYDQNINFTNGAKTIKEQCNNCLTNIGYNWHNLSQETKDFYQKEFNTLFGINNLINEQNVIYEYNLLQQQFLDQFKNIDINDQIIDFTNGTQNIQEQCDNCLANIGYNWNNLSQETKDFCQKEFKKFFEIENLTNDKNFMYGYNLSKQHFLDQFKNVDVDGKIIDFTNGAQTIEEQCDNCLSNIGNTFYSFNEDF